ncbi:MAG: BNR-4 repeat-containing protein [Pirellulaceae bacterium]|nr:PD40 domain-containing protein [Planctomycetales bacterium]
MTRFFQSRSRGSTASVPLIVFAVLIACGPPSVHGEDPARNVATSDDLSSWQIGYTEFRTNLPGGRHANVRTERAIVSCADGSWRRRVADELVDDPNAWTQFAGWSPDGSLAVVARGWQNPDNATWEERHQTFRMDPGQWQLDTCLVDLQSGFIENVTATDRVSHYNGGLFFTPDAQSLGFTALIDGVSKPYLMDRDGRKKRDVSGHGNGFAYGYSASPDGIRISYHEDYQIYIAAKDGSQRRHIDTGNPFNFAPSWSPDGQWLLFVSGEHGHSNPFVVKSDGTELRKIADLAGYQGWIEFLDVPDFHHGSSDVPVWSADGDSIFYTAKVGENVELFRFRVKDTVSTQLTKTPPGTLHYHPKPSPDGRWLLIGTFRNRVRQLIVIDLVDGRETMVTRLPEGHGAMWPHWRPRLDAAQLSEAESERGIVSVILRGDAETEFAPHGTGNVYAPDVHRSGAVWRMWYGGQGIDGHDRIHVAESVDGRSWKKQGVVVDCGSANHVNDPSVVRAGGKWWMFFTVAETAEDDEIAAAVSTDGQTWQKLGVVFSRGNAGAWDSRKVGRPSVLYEDGIFRLWYDGQATKAAAEKSRLAQKVRQEGRAVGYAESKDGRTWQRRDGPVFHHGAGAVDVERVKDRYVMVYESSAGVNWAESRDGIEWQSRGQLLGVSGKDLDRYGHVTPHLTPAISGHDGDMLLYVGAAGRRTWDGNSVAVANVRIPDSSLPPHVCEIHLTCVDDKATGYGTFQSHNQKVVANRRGYFMTHIRTRNDAYTAQQWRLSWSRDQGQSFHAIYEATHATNPPVLETDEDDNIYLIRPDFDDGHAYFYRFLSDNDYREPLVTQVPHGSAGKFCMAIDNARKQIYYFAHNNTFHRMSFAGKILSKVDLLQAGENALLQYPLMCLDEKGVLHVAWTTQKHGVYLYWDIHYMRSRDGGVTWQTMSGAELTLPVVADEGGAADRQSICMSYRATPEHHAWCVWQATTTVRRGEILPRARRWRTHIRSVAVATLPAMVRSSVRLPNRPHRPPTPVVDRKCFSFGLTPNSKALRPVVGYLMVQGIRYAEPKKEDADTLVAELSGRLHVCRLTGALRKLISFALSALEPSVCLIVADELQHVTTLHRANL